MGGCHDAVIISPETIETVGGVHGTELTPDILARLPGDWPPAPWEVVATALCWVAPPSRAARRALQPGLAGMPLSVVGMLVSYESTPVGRYKEVMGAVGVRRGATPAGHVPFIAVDSPASVVGGRMNWSLPKTLAEFSGDPVLDRAMTGTHPAWEISATARALGPAFGVRGKFRLFQVGFDGHEHWARTTARARVRPALVQVLTSGTPAVTDWLRSGRYPGFVVERLEAALTPTRPA